MNVAEALKAVTSGEVLTETQAEAVLGSMFDENPSQLQIAAFLGALRARGENVSELTGFARAMRARAVPVPAQSPLLVDTCGTGGDSPKSGIGTFNISTAASLVAAAAGVKIAKHGNRAMSSKSGSADVLEALGVHLNLTPEAIGRCIDTVGIGFMFAQSHHPSMKSVAPIRRELGIRTVFNLLGPLTNPAGAHRQVMGVPAKQWLGPIAETLAALGCERALVVHSQDGLDEFSTCAPTDGIELRDGKLTPFSVDSHDLGIGCQDPRDLAGGTAEQNAVIIQQVLHDGEGPSADVVCLNAASVLLVADLAEDWAGALDLARATIKAGAARETLQHLREFTEQYAS